MTVTELHYNTDGNVAGVRLEVPPEIDAAFSWGRAVDGLACSLKPSKARGSFGDMGLWITVKNTAKEDRKVVTIGKNAPEFILEVRSADGNVVPQDPEYARKVREGVVNPNEADVAQTLGPGKAELVAWGRELLKYFATLPPGKYTMTVTCRSGEKLDIVSNTAAFEIVDATTAATQPGR
jgi:hypothetical protein